ncbi:MAG: NUDIX hydrolase [Lachnospiraceae bacterium]|jgi:8-oxo-dGTP pyrophosphatase MutT (NUDIX family)|nr:NUDIX hydrolase [Lachnospiraceae bacterium]
MHYLQEIESFVPTCEQEAGDKGIFLEYISQYPHTILTRDCRLGHLTASSMIFNPGRDKVLMVYHNIYQSWSWTGGHADGEEEMLGVAIREAQEETGIKHLRLLGQGLFALDVLPVWGHWKRGSYVSAHMHLNFTYLLEAEETEALQKKEDENSGVCWIPISKLSEYVTEPDMLPVYEKMIRGREQVERTL